MTTHRLLTFAILSMLPAAGIAQVACRAQSGPQRTPLLELYTSEGCSSCPPADRWLSGLAGSSDPSSLNLLALHVDYWDSIGWRDRFGQAAFGDRQRDRATSVGKPQVYTPQVMSGARVDVPWHSAAGVGSALAAARVQPAPVALSLQVKALGPVLRVDVAATAKPGLPAGGRLYLALTQDGLVSAVNTGENAGKQLHHDRVVRGLWGPWSLDAHGAQRSMDVSVPAGAALARLRVVAFVQNRSDGDTLQSLGLPLASCAPGAVH
jgi:hypothetical protein